MYWVEWQQAGCLGNWPFSITVQEQLLSEVSVAHQDDSYSGSFFSFKRQLCNN